MRKFAIVLVLIAILALSVVMPAFGGVAPPGLHKAPAVGNVNPHVVCARCHTVTSLPAALCARCHS